MRHELTPKEQRGVALQKAYYTETAGLYDSMHFSESSTKGHNLACSLMHGLALLYQYESILDLGSGTGRVIRDLRDKLPGVRIVGIEPVAALREIGYQSGIARDSLVEGDATALNYADGSFDLVCAYGILHHIPNPRLAVENMLRVAKKAIFISDGNRFAQGPYIARLIKLFCHKIGAWPLVNYMKTKGKGYTVSQGDGIMYSYSVFDDYDYISKHCKTVLLFNLEGGGKHPLTEAPSIGLLGVKA